LVSSAPTVGCVVITHCALPRWIAAIAVAPAPTARVRHRRRRRRGCLRQNAEHECKNAVLDVVMVDSVLTGFVAREERRQLACRLGEVQGSDDNQQDAQQIQQDRHGDGRVAS
jgi:hypothetical protein